MQKTFFSLLTALFTAAIIWLVNSFGGPDLLGMFNSLTAKTDTINGVTVKGDGTKYPVKFVRKADGDTIVVLFNKQELTVRYLNVDTPETVKPNTPPQPFGKEASAANEGLLKRAKKVEIEFDVGEKKDKYDRALAYVYADGKLVQEILLRQGLAQIKYVKEPNTRHLSTLKKAESQAKANKRNIWSQ
ncbi:MAG: thermonuclease family protein [Gemella sp.]|nr:thermonuclease family protein [Gemella sp.]